MLKKGAKGKPTNEESESEEESDDDEEDDDDDDEEEEEDFMPLGDKRPRQANGDSSFSKRQKLDNATGKLTVQC